MSRHRSLAVLAFLVFAAIGCAGSLRPVPPTPPAATLTVAPPYRDPEYVVRLTLARPAEWDERYHLDGGEDAPDPILRLTHRVTGAVIEVLFLPRAGGTPAEFAARLRSGLGAGATSTAVIASPSGDDASFESASAGTRTKHRIIRNPGMSRSYVYLRVTAPTASFAAASGTFDGLASSIAVVHTGPLSPTAALAQCLADKGVRLYGAWWCGPCHMQERMFGDGASRLEHIQCSAPGEHDQLPVCERAGIMSYPTWTFPDGSRLEGVQELGDLAAKAGCPAPPAGSGASTPTGPDGI